MGGVERHVLPDCADARKLVIMLAHAGGGSPVRDEAKMQNLAFMLSSADGGEEKMGFRPGAHGPHSDMVEGEVRHLNDLGILSIDGGKARLTSAGRAVAERLAEEDPGAFETVARYKEMFNDMSDDEILTYVRLAYPAMASSSPAADKPGAEEHVMSMLRNEKISASKAAELLGESVEYVIDAAFKRGIYVLGH